MSTPNPLAPQGSLLEQQAKGRSTFHVISFIGAVHVMLLCGILWTACSKDEKPKVETPNTVGSTDPYAAPPADPSLGGLPGTGGLPPAPSSNSPSASPVTPPTTIGVPTQPPTPAGSGLGAGGAGGGSGPAVTPNLPPSNPVPPVGGGSGPEITLPTPASPAGEYKIAKGDIGESVAKKHGVSMKALATANPSVNWSRLKVGQSIQIPAASAATGTPSAPAGTSPDAGATSGTVTYVVKAGDTGTKIATKHGVKWAEIRKASRLTSDALHPGQKLTIPAHAAGAAAAPGAAPAGNTAQPSATPVIPKAPGQ